MRFWLLTVLIASLLGYEAEAQQPFLKPMQVTSREIYQESMRVLNPGDEPTLVATYEFTVTIAAAISPAEAQSFNENMSFSISVGDFSIGEIDNLILGMDENFDSQIPGMNREANFTFTATDIESADFDFGKVRLEWNDLDTLNIKITFTTTAPDGQKYLEPRFSPLYSLRAYDASIDSAPVEDIQDSISFASIKFGPYSQDPMVYYVAGISTVTGEDSLTRVVLDGATDFVRPTATITMPLPNLGNLPVTEPSIVLAGMVRDRYNIGIKSFVNTTDPIVEYYLSAVATLPSSPIWTPASVSPERDAEGFAPWTSPVPVDLNPGLNYLFLRVTDSEGNELSIGPRIFRFTTTGQITITGAATGFPPGDAGTVVGTVAGSGAVFKNPKKISIKAGESPSPASDTRLSVEGGRTSAAIANPSSEAIFNGWTATVDGDPFALDPAERVKERMTFLTRPRIVIIGNFVPNPFLQDGVGVGAYLGYSNGPTTADRGTFVGKVSKSGAFSGKLKLGKLTLPVKGKFLGTGDWEGLVTKKGVSYIVKLTITVVAGLQAIEGTVTGGGLHADIVSDRIEWKKRVNEATEYEGNYNVLLPATGTVPDGIGYGRVSISKLGKVKFAGKAGNGAPMSFSSALFERSASEVVFPFYAPLEKKLGSIVGEVAYDSTDANSDLSGTLTWFKPVTTKVEPSQISGEIDLHGSKYMPPPAKGSRIMLGTSGAGRLTFRGPPITLPVVAPNAFLNSLATLATNHALDGIVDSASATKTTLKFSAKTGLFTGKFFDPTTRKSYSFSGAASQKANTGAGSAAGFLTRGNRTGYVIFGPP